MQQKDAAFDVLVIGGGFYGLSIAQFWAERGKSVLLTEAGAESMKRASYNNQARVHMGYHYPRSLLTALRSRMNAPRFLQDYGDVIHNNSRQQYAVARNLSKVSADHFQSFSSKIGASLSIAKEGVVNLFDARLVERVFTVFEPAFDSSLLRKVIEQKLEKQHVTYLRNAQVKRVARERERFLKAEILLPEGLSVFRARQIYNCTYSAINSINAASGLPLIPLKHEITEMALVKAPEGLRDFSITVMCGPFFSIMPFPAEGLHTVSHVRYTPHQSWVDGEHGPYQHPYKVLESYSRKSAYPAMMRDIARYFPAIKDYQYQRSLWEVKTVLPEAEDDDGRPILFKKNHGLPGYICIMGGKIDNIYDILDELHDSE